MRIKIVSDGTAEGTAVYDALGHKVEGAISRIDIVIDANNRQAPSRAVLTIDDPEVEIVAEREGD
jgi:hypothetical protein